MIVMVTNVCVQIDAPISDISGISCIEDAERASRLITVSVAWSQKLVNHWISSPTFRFSSLGFDYSWYVSLLC